MEKHSELVFISNELLCKYKKMNLPLKFITFAHTEGIMYNYYLSDEVFYVTNNLGVRTSWGNTKVYGAVFLVKDYFFYVDLLDAYHICSKNKLLVNHEKDLHHRVNIMVTPIKFNTIRELSSLRYREGQEVEVVSYVGNVKHPKIKQCILASNSYRKVNGCYEKGIKRIFREVVYE